MTLISNASSLFIGTLIGYIIATRCTNTKKKDSSSTPSSSSAASLSDLFPPLSSNLSSIEFGSIIRSTLFALRPSPSIFLNHASYGTVPLPVIDAQQRLAIRVENHPDEWFRKDNWIITQQALKEISSFVHCPVSDLVFVNNATSAVNAVLLSIEPLLTSDDILFTLNTTYNACKLSMMHTADRTGAVYHEANLRFPLSSADDALQQIMETIDSLKKSTGKRIRFALFDLITSPTAIVMPYKELAAECRRRDILCFLDGAHAIGQLSLNLSEFDCDFLTTNLHKWLFAPKGAALFYCNPRLQESIKIHPVLTSHSYRDTFQQRFWMQGTRDDSSYISAVYGLRFATAVGIDRMKDYNRNLANWAENYLCKEWSCCKDTDHSHPLCPSSMSAPNMRVLRVPLSVPPSALQIPGIDEWNAGKLWAEKLMMILFERFDVIVTLFYLEGKLYCRFSSQIYNDKKDYQRLAEIIKIYKAEIEAENK